MRRSVLAALATVTVVLLSGCVPQSRADLERYIDELQQHEAVQEITYGVSTPLPFSVQGSATVTLVDSITPEQLDDFAREACNRDVNASVHFTLTYALGAEASLSHDVGSRCYFERTAWIDAVNVMTENADAIGDVRWGVVSLDDGDETRIDLSAEGTAVGDQAAAADSILDALAFTGGTYEITTSDLDVEADYAMTRAALQSLVGLSAQYPVATAKFADGLVVQIDTVSPEVAAEAGEWFASNYPDVPVIQFLDAKIEVGSGVPSAQAIAVTEAVTETGLAESVKVDRFGVTIDTDAPATSLAILDSLGSLADGTRITFISPMPLGYAVTSSASADASQRVQRDKLALAADLYSTLKDDPTVNSIVVDRLGVEVQTTEQYWTDDAAIAPLQDTVADVVERHDLKHLYVTVNNRPVRGYSE